MNIILKIGEKERRYPLSRRSLELVLLCGKIEIEGTIYTIEHKVFDPESKRICLTLDEDLKRSAFFNSVIKKKFK